MGLPLISTGGCEQDGKRAPVMNGQPNPRRFEVLERGVVGSCIVVRVRYPDCTNYEGEKVLLYDDAAKFAALEASGVLDPHFLEGLYCPIARFVPTAQGWRIAIETARMLSDVAEVAPRS